MTIMTKIIEVDVWREIDSVHSENSLGGGHEELGLEEAAFDAMRVAKVSKFPAPQLSTDATCT